MFRTPSTSSTLPSAACMAVVCLALLIAGPLAHAQKIYKYRDADGKVVYSQQAPKGVKAKEIQPKVRKVSPEEARKRLDALDEQSRGTQENRELREREQADVGEQEERRKENCKQARKNLDVLNTSARVQTADENGNLFYLDEAAKQAKTEEAQRQIKEFCN